MTALLAVLLLSLSAHAAPERRGALPRAALAQVEVLARPMPPWSSEALAAWGGPWSQTPGLYDHRYVTW